MNGEIGINDVTIGYSTTGAQAYLVDLNAKAITETKEMLADIQGIKSALEKGWIGQAELNFVANLQKAVTNVQSTLDQLKTTLDTQFAQIEETWAEQDKNIVPLD